MELIQNHELTASFLAILFPEMENEFIEIRGVHSIDKEVSPYFLESRERLVNELDGMDVLKKNTNVYIGVCPRSRKGGTKDAVSRAHVLWLDLDVKNPQSGEKQGVLKRLEDFMFPPTIIVDSGNGYHAYWALKESESDQKLIERYLRSLAGVLSADKSCCEVARVLRLPGTLNRKVEHAPLDVRIVCLDANRTYNLSDFDLILQPIAEDTAAKRKPDDWMADTLSNISEGNRNASFTSIAGRLHHDGHPPSAIVALLSPYAERHQFPDAELRGVVEGICRRYPPKTSFPDSPYNSEITETESKVMEAIPLAKFMEGESQNIEWLVDRILPKEAVGILAAPAGYGKSWMLLDLAIEYSRGGKWLEHFQTQAGRLLYLDEESSPNLLRRRLGKLLAAKIIQEPALDIHFAVGQGLRLSDKKSVSRLSALLDSLRPSLVVIDSLIRVHGAEENSATEMAKSFAVVKGWVREFGCSFLFADHQKKPGPYGTSPDLLLRGSTEKAAFVDTLLSLRKKENSLIVEHSKSRFDEAVPAFVVQIADRTENTTSVFYTGEAEALKEEARLEAAMEFLESALQSGEWFDRKTLVADGKKGGVSVKAIDEALKVLEAEGMVEKDKRKPESGRGGKAAFFRWIKESEPDVEAVAQ